MGMRGRTPDAALERVWQARLGRWRRSEETVHEFCAAEGVSAASFYAWRRRLALASAATVPGPQFVPVRVTVEDPDGEKVAGGLIVAKKISSRECHEKYG
jgi:hypothetical protein